MAHTATSGEGWFDSGQLAAGESFAHQFDKPGTFRYHCTNHPQMEGVIIVLAGGAVAPALFDGKAVEIAFRDSCSGCHGPNREGATGPALIPARLAADDDTYFGIIKNGKPGTVMPAWGPAGLSDEEIWALVGYIRSEPEAEAVEVNVIDEGVQTLHPEFTQDARFVYVSDWQANVVRVYDASTFGKVAEMGGVTTPTGIFNTSRRGEMWGH